MKLIIDISEGSYNTIKGCYEKGELLTTICMQIATGTPYEEQTPYKEAYNKTLEEMKKECRSMTKPMEYLYYGECLGTFEQTFNKHLREAENESNS